jgi:hypothetical protein
LTLRKPLLCGWGQGSALFGNDTTGLMSGAQRQRAGLQTDGQQCAQNGWQQRKRKHSHSVPSSRGKANSHHSGEGVTKLVIFSVLSFNDRAHEDVPELPRYNIS